VPSLFAEQGYTTALFIDAAVRAVKGKIEDEEAFHKALMSAPTRFKSPRGEIKMAHNGTPVQDYYVRVVAKDKQGRIVNKKVGTVVTGLGDYWAKDCNMK
jgi:branched-chain amino acid transport system substrate-binding protein